MSENNLSNLDSVGVKAIQNNAPDAPSPAPEKKTPPRKSVNAKKFFLGCFGTIVVLFVLLVVAMIFGLASGEDTIKSLGFDPVSFKNFTIGLVNVIFGAATIIVAVVFITQLLKRILANPEDKSAKRRSAMATIVSGVIFVLLLTTWIVVYGYINRFRAETSGLAEKILTTPIDTFSLVSPIQVNFSAENITALYVQNYALVSYEWDKDNDGIVDATGEKVQLYFQDGGKNNGVYNVTLRVKMQPRVSGDAASQAAQKAIVTKSYQRVVSISKQEIYGEILANPENGELPLEVSLDASTVKDPHGASILNYSWDFNDDGQIDLEGLGYKRTVHTFKTIGAHKVALTVTSNDFEADGQHEQKTFRKTITVQEPLEMVDAAAVITATPKSGAAPLVVNLDASASTVGQQKIDRYEWVIGDGATKLFGVRSRYEFKKPGKYPVTLKVIFANGQIKTDTLEINVTDAVYAPKAVITSEPAVNRSYRAVIGPAPLTVVFSATDSIDKDNNIVSYEWDFDADGKSDASGNSASHEYKDEGKYRAVLRITDADGNISEASVDVLVGSELPLVDLGASTLSGPAPLVVDFDASGSRLPGKRIVTYEWDFNAEMNSRAQTFLSEKAQTSHVFDKIGEYLVKLTLHGDDGSTVIGTTKIIATYEPLNAFFTPSRTIGTAPLAVTFDSTGSKGDIVSYAWNFGDDAVSTEKNPVHIFQKSGIYSVMLIVLDSQKNVSQVMQTIEVQ